mgnify:CR=1 FL=1
METITDKIETEKDLECLIFENYLLAKILDDVTYSHDNENDIKRERERAFYGKEE